jgi:hypothetical protein
MITESLAFIVAGIIAYLQEIQNDKRFSEQQRQAALIALSKAFNATEGYYAELGAQGEKSVIRQHEIAQLWDEAAICIEPFHGGLANRLGLKSRFWREGAAWSDEQIADANIQLEKVRRDGRFALIQARA